MGDSKRERAACFDLPKGRLSVLYGQGDPGGVINLVTHRPLPDAASAANLTLGNFHFYRSELDATGPLNAGKTVLHRLNMAGQKAHSFIDCANRDLAAIASTVTWLMSPRTTCMQSKGYRYVDQQPPAADGPAAR